MIALLNYSRSALALGIIILIISATLACGGSQSPNKTMSAPTPTATPSPTATPTSIPTPVPTATTLPPTPTTIIPKCENLPHPRHLMRQWEKYQGKCFNVVGTVHENISSRMYAVMLQDSNYPILVDVNKCAFFPGPGTYLMFRAAPFGSLSSPSGGTPTWKTSFPYYVEGVGKVFVPAVGCLEIPMPENVTPPPTPAPLKCGGLPNPDDLIAQPEEYKGMCFNVVGTVHERFTPDSSTVVVEHYQRLVMLDKYNCPFFPRPGIRFMFKGTLNDDFPTTAYGSAWIPVLVCLEIP